MKGLIKKYLIFYSTMLCLSGCAFNSESDVSVYTQNTLASDGHRFLVKEYQTLTPNVEFILMSNQSQYEEILKENFGHNWDKVSAFTKWNPKSLTCKIYIKDPSWRYEPELIGHEVAHCIWGRFHKGTKGLGPRL